jgi:hypothetical protein
MFTNHDEHVYYVVVDSSHIDQDFDYIVVENHVLVVLHYLDIVVEIDLIDL